MKVSIITPSFAPDFERCQILCESMDKLVSHYQSHIIVVDAADYALFRSLESEKREVIIKEDYMPSWLMKLPLTKNWWFSSRTLPVRGWILQQIMKLSANQYCDSDLFLFVDSDVAFIREFDVNDIYIKNDAKLLSLPRKTEDFFDSRKQNWHNKAADLFGITNRKLLTQDYISQLVVWRRDTLKKMLDFIENTKGKPWQQVLCNHMDFSEYTLYGVFAEHVLKSRSGHFLSKQESCYCSWHHQIKNLEDLENFLSSVPDTFNSVLIQSNLDISVETYLNQIHSIQEKLRNESLKN